MPYCRDKKIVVYVDIKTKYDGHKELSEILKKWEEFYAERFGVHEDEIVCVRKEEHVEYVKD